MDLINDVKTLADLGLSAILLFMLFTLWRDRQDAQKANRQTIKEKDDNLADVNKEVLNVVRENTKTQEQLRATITEHMTLTEKFYDAIRKS